MDYLKGTYEHLSNLSATGTISPVTGMDALPNVSMPDMGISVSVGGADLSGTTFDVQV